MQCRGLQELWVGVCGCPLVRACEGEGKGRGDVGPPLPLASDARSTRSAPACPPPQEKGLPRGCAQHARTLRATRHFRQLVHASPCALPRPRTLSVQDGRWGYAPSLPTRLDGDNTNNWVGVPYRNTSPEVQVSRRGGGGGGGGE